MASTIAPEYLAKVRQLYSEQSKSAREISEQLEVSIDAVYYFLRRHKIPRRTATEQNSLRFKRQPLSFTIKNKLSHFDQELFIAGVMLYWGEGSKWKGETTVDFANSDPQMVVVFVNFLRQICGVNEKRLRCYFYCYQNQNIEKIIRFWSRTTGIPVDQFTKPYVRKDYRPSKVGKMPYGLIHIRYSDKKLLDMLREWIVAVASHLGQPIMGRYRSGQTGLTVKLAAFSRK